MSDDLDALPTIVAVLRAAGTAFGARGIARLVALDDGVVLEIHVDAKETRLVDDDVDIVDLPAFVRAITAGESPAPAPGASTRDAPIAHGDRGIFGWLLFPSDRGRSARKFAAATIDGELPARWIEVAPALLSGDELVPTRADDLIAQSRASAIAKPEQLSITTDAVELKIQALLAPSHAAEWIPKLLALLRAANSHGAQGDVVVVDLDGSDGVVIELRKNTMDARLASDDAIKKTLGWPLRKTLRQQTGR